MLFRFPTAILLFVGSVGAQTPIPQNATPSPLTIISTTTPQGPESKLVAIPDSSKQTIIQNVPGGTQAIELKPPPNITLGSQGLGQSATPIGPLLTGWPVCGGFVNGKLQPKCPPEPAIFVAEAVGACPPGSFFDPNGSCWSCPDGFVRTADPVTGPTACSRADSSVPLKQEKATFQGGICPSGSFFDPIRGGECYSCPAGYRRSAAHIDAPNACFVPAGEELKPARRIKRTPWPHECGGGSFHDAWDGGGCWSCPGGFNRTGNHINSGQACSRAVSEKHATATNRGKGECKPNEIYDPRNGGECWTCRPGTYRTVHPVNGNEACEQRAGVALKPAQNVSPFSCPAGSFMDLISSRDANVQERIRKQQTATGKPVRTTGSLGATCWSCPPGFIRDIYHVASDSACYTPSIKWQPAVFPQPGLFSFPGAEAVARAVLAERKLLESLIDAAANDTKVPLNQLRVETYQAIATEPQSSALLAAAVFARVQAAITNPQQATPDELQLTKAFAEHIRLHRSFIAKSALDAYDHWVDAMPRQLAAQTEAAEKNMGGAPFSMERQRLNQMAFKGGEIPPDFDEIVWGSVLAQVAAPVTMQALMLSSTSTPQLEKLIFPNRYARRFVQKRTEDIAEDSGKLALKNADDAGKGVAKHGDEIAKVGKEFAKKSASKGTSRVLLGALAKFGPQLMADVVVEMAAAVITHYEAVLNARPKLVTNLGGAQQPVNLARELTADPGWVYSQWAAALGDGGPTPGSLGQMAALARAAMDAGAPAVGSPVTAPATPGPVPAPAKVGPRVEIKAAITRQASEAVAGMPRKLGVFEFVTVVPWPAQLKPTALQTPEGLPMHSSRQDDSGCPAQAKPGDQCKQRFQVQIDTRARCDFGGKYLAHFDVVCRPGAACQNGWAEVPLSLGNASACN